MRAICLMTMMAVLPLAGCGSGDMMTSFDAEKSRIRGALSTAVECVERNDTSGGRSLECRSPGQSLRVELYEYAGAPQGVTRKIDVRLELNDGMMEVEAAAWEFRRVLDAYGFGKDDVTKCLDRKSFAEQARTFRVMCEIVDGVGAKATINQTKAV